MDVYLFWFLTKQITNILKDFRFKHLLEINIGYFMPSLELGVSINYVTHPGREEGPL